MITSPIHPDDILLFNEVAAAMRRVAAKYDLPLRSVSGYPMPLRGMADRMGDCNSSGHIRLVMRCTVDGEWCAEPLSPDTIWDTAAHELAHLRHMNHSDEFNEFWEELHVAMRNQQEDHRQKVIKKLLKLQNQMQGEKAIGNSEAAEAFAGMVNKMLVEYELNPSDLDYARVQDDDPVVEIRVNTAAYGIDRLKARSAWQETLARSVASAHLCSFLIQLGTNNIVFVGTRSHATVAEYVYGTLVPLVDKMSKQAEVRYWHETGCGRGVNNKAKGYRSAWIDGFLTRIWQRFEEAKRAAVAERVAQAGMSSETALLRLDGALVKVRKYIEDKFSSHKAARSANALNRRSAFHSRGREDGRSAADSIALGRRGMTGGGRKQIGE